MDKILLNDKEYNVIRLLGHGKDGYFYLVEKDNFKYVLKQIHHEPCNYNIFDNKITSELNDYDKLIETNIRIPKLLDIDIKNERILKEYIAGPTICKCNSYMEERNFSNWGIKYWSKMKEFLDYINKRL